MVRFVEKRIEEPTWILQPQTYGFIPHLNLQMLEIPEKVKPNPPTIPDSTYQNLTTEKIAPIPPEGGQKPQVVEKSSPVSSEKSVEISEHSEIDSNRKRIASRFTDSDDEESVDDMPEPEAEEVEVSVHEPEDPETEYAKTEIEKRHLKRKFRELGIDFEETDTLEMLRMADKFYEDDKTKRENKSGTVTTNKMLLSLLMLGADSGLEWYDNKLDGYLKYQMQLMPLYENVLHKMDDTEISEIIFGLPPAIQLTLGLGLSTAGFIGMKKWGLEDKIKHTKFLETVIPGYSNAIDAMTSAVKEDKPVEKPSEPSRKRGPSMKAEDIGKI